jgi:hypothetical protein
MAVDITNVVALPKIIVNPKNNIITSYYNYEEIFNEIETKHQNQTPA